MELTKQIAAFYKSNGINSTTTIDNVTYIDPIIKLSPEQEIMLLSGDGQSNPNEYKQINSSTGLAVNYYLLLEKTGSIEELKFEDKVEKSLKGRGGRKANIDVSYKRDGKTVYVESKFLEPYYSGNEQNRDAYFNTKNYDVPDSSKDSWYNLFLEAQDYKYYNFSQLCRHLLAIWRKHKGDEETIVLQSVTWKMTDCFISNLPTETDKKFYAQRRSSIEEEASKCQIRINDFLEQILWSNMKFEVLHYNDLLEDIKESNNYHEFKKRYFL